MNDFLVKDKKFVVGDAFTVADAYLYIVLTWEPYAKFDTAPFPNVQAYFEGTFCKYVCVSLCTVCMYIMLVCMYVYQDLKIMYLLIYVCIYVCQELKFMYLFMYVCMYVKTVSLCMCSMYVIY